MCKVKNYIYFFLNTLKAVVYFLVIYIHIYIYIYIYIYSDSVLNSPFIQNKTNKQNHSRWKKIMSAFSLPRTIPPTFEYFE